MIRSVKIVAIIAGLLLLVVIALPLLAKLLISPEQIRARVLPLAEQALGRQVELGAIDIRLFSGIQLQDLRIKEQDGQTDFVRTKEASLRYRLWPLLQLRLEVDEIRLVEPQIRLQRLADGRFNFSDLLAAPATAKEQAAAEPPVKTLGTDSGATPAIPLNLNIASLQLQDAELLWFDAAVNPTTPLQYRIDQVQLGASDIDLTRPFPFEFRARLGGAPLQLDGQVDLIRQQISLRLQLDQFDVLPLRPYLQDPLPGQLNALRLSLDLQAEGSPDQLRSSGSLRLDPLSLRLAAEPALSFNNSTLALRYALEFNRPGQQLDLEQAEIDFNGIVASATGRIEALNRQPRLDLQVQLAPLDLRQVLKALPQELAQQLTTVDPAGSLSLQAQISGTADQGARLLRQARIELRQVQANVGSLRPSLSGPVQIQGDRLNAAELLLLAGPNQARIELQGENLFGKPIRLQQKITSERFDVDALLAASAAPAQVAGKQPTPTGKAPAKVAEELGPFDLPLQLDGQVQITEARYRGLTIRNFELRYHLLDNQLTIENLTGQTLGGSFSQQGRVDLRRKGLAYQTKTTLQGLQADPLVSALLPAAAGTLFGQLDLNLDLNGQGTLSDSLRQNLSGNGSIKLADGRLSGNQLTRDLAAFLQLDELRELVFRQVDGRIQLDRGRVKIDSVFDSSRLRMKPQGQVGLDGSLDLTLGASLAPELMQKLDRKGSFSRLLTGADGWGQLPLKLSGSYSAPRFALDSRALGQQAGQQLQQQLLQKLLPPQPSDTTATASDATAPPAENPPPAEQQPANLLDQAVRGLFQRQ